MQQKSRYAYRETIDRLTSTITGGGNTIFVTIDQAAAAQSVGLTMRPTTLIVFGNPKGGTPLMEAYPLMALHLPIKLLVWEQNGAVQVAAADMAALAAGVGVPAGEPHVAALDKALATLIGSVAG
ncbi:MAG TPA: DUF302 domain-containing protein [Candidatus Sulfotelmatobacter sp.]|nr:DUF302 domain-containing protein [Candidatus Sulfotelmatobacter sp.]